MGKVIKEKHYADGFTLICPEDISKVDPKFVFCNVDYSKIKRYFLYGHPVPAHFKIKYRGETYGAGECYRPANRPEAEPQAAPAVAPQAAQKAPESAPTLDMFDNTDPNAPGTTDQNSAFWGLMDRLGKLTGKTGEEMKPVVVTRALGENKGTSKLTVAEMDRVIRFVKETIELFERHEWAVKSAEVREWT